MNACHPAGGFPGKGSDFENTWYAVQLMDLLKNFSSLKSTDLELTNLVQHYQKEDGGMSAEKNNGTLWETFQAIEGLNISDQPYNGLDINALKNYLNASIINNTFFASSLSENDTSLAYLYAGLRLCTLLQLAYGETKLNTSFVYDYLLSFFQNKVSSTNFALFDEGDGKPFASTFYALQSLSLLNLLEQNRSSSNSFVIANSSGDFLQGTNSSLTEVDEDRLLVSASPTHEINLTIDVSLAKQLYSLQDEFGFTFLLNTTESVTNNASLFILNASNDTWIKITQDLELNAISEGNGLFHIQTGIVNITNYAQHGEDPYDESIKLSLYFNHTDDFNLSINYFDANFTVFNRTYVAGAVNSSFSLYSGCFDEFQLSENYYALKILEFLNYSSGIQTYHSADLASFVGEFDIGQNLYTGERFNYPDYLDVYLSSTFFANSILNFTGGLTPEIGNSSLQFMRDWKFFDGGFGGPSSLSLQYTYQYILYLKATNQITPEIRNIVLSFVHHCQINSSMVGYSFQDDFTPTYLTADTYYALKIYEILDDIHNIPHYQEIASYFIAQQSAEGYFFTIGSVDDIFFSLNVILLTGNILNINDVTLVNYIVNLQAISGGFLANKYDSLPRMDSTCSILMIAKAANFLEDIRLESDFPPGSITFLAAHQNRSAGGGGFYEVQTNFGEEASTTGDITTSAMVIQALTALQEIQGVDSGLLLSYIISLNEYFNDTSTLNVGGDEHFSFVTGMMNRIELLSSFQRLGEWKLRIQAAINSRTAVRNANAEIFINVSSPYGDLLENAQVSVTQQIEEKKVVILKDQQNGTYSGELLQYPNTGTFVIGINCSYGGYIGFTQNFSLTIVDVFREEEMHIQTGVQLWVASEMDYSITLVNSSSGSLIVDANVVLLNEAGQVEYNLTDPDSNGVYETTLQFSPWYMGTRQFTLLIQKVGFRTEEYPINITLYPLWFVIILIIFGAFLVSATIFVARNRQKLLLKLRKLIARIKGKSLGFQQIGSGKAIEDRKPGKSAELEKKATDQKKNQEKGLDYA